MILFHWCCVRIVIMTVINKTYWGVLVKWAASWQNQQNDLCIRPVWSESFLSAWRNIGSSAIHWVHLEDSDQTGQVPRLIWVFAGRTDHFVGFVTRLLKYDFMKLEAECAIFELFMYWQYHLFRPNLTRPWIWFMLICTWTCLRF